MLHELIKMSCDDITQYNEGLWLCWTVTPEYISATVDEEDLGNPEYTSVDIYYSKFVNM